MQRVVLISVIVGAFVASFSVQHWLTRDSADAASQAANTPAAPARIVSLAPSSTEVLFALGLGDSVVGVTRYCDYPPEAAEKPRVGGYYDPNYERIVQLRPDLVVTLPEHDEAREQLHELGMKTLTVNHGTVDGILDSIDIIGAACGAVSQAKELQAGLRRRMERVSQRTSGQDRPRVIVSLGRPVEEESARRIYVCGPGSIYHELIGLAGGTNGYTDDVSYPRISAEGIVSINPDVIVDMVSDMEGQKRSAADIRRDWAELPGLAAVSNNRVHVLTGDHLTVPGPRFILLLEELAQILHPDK